jgi:hypothetical protein
MMHRRDNPANTALRRAIQQRAQRSDPDPHSQVGRTLKSPVGGGILGQLQDAYGQAYGQNLYGQMYGNYMDPMKFLEQFAKMLGTAGPNVSRGL